MRAAALALLAILVPRAALAADAAESAVLGYSSDGRYFAFEQFGTQDGSGFPYAEVFVVDLQSNSWVDGAPIRILIEDEGATLGAAHTKAITAAAPVLLKNHVTEPAFVLASTPATEVQEDRGTITFDPYYRHMGGSVPLPAAGMWGERYEVKVTATDVSPLPEHCKDYGEPVKALTVTLTELKSAKVTTVHQDAGIPKSRGCPQGYDIDKVVAPAAYGENPRFVVLVGVYSFGFEGQDRRYIAIPARPE